MSFPALVLVLSLLAVLGPGLLNLILALSILGAAGGSRVIRSATLSVMHSGYVEAARALGAGGVRIVVRYVLPNVMGTIIILATIGLGTLILAESALSFLGFGSASLSVLGRCSGRAPPSRWPSSLSTCWAMRSGMCWIRAFGARGVGCYADRVDPICRVIRWSTPKE